MRVELVKQLSNGFDWLADYNFVGNIKMPIYIRPFSIDVIEKRLKKLNKIK